MDFLSIHHISLEPCSCNPDVQGSTHKVGIHEFRGLTVVILMVESEGGWPPTLFKGELYIVHSLTLNAQPTVLLTRSGMKLI